MLTRLELVPMVGGETLLRFGWRPSRSRTLLKAYQSNGFCNAIECIRDYLGTQKGERSAVGMLVEVTPVPFHPLLS